MGEKVKISLKILFVNHMSAWVSTDVILYPQNTYDQIASETKFQLLLTNVVNRTTTEDVRTMAAVLLRRLLTTNFDEIIPTVSNVNFFYEFFRLMIYMKLTAYPHH